jgi:Fructose-1-6-bisphosphatase, N-terminal domain
VRGRKIVRGKCEGFCLCEAPRGVLPLPWAKCEGFCCWVLQPGREMVAAGYCLYGSSCALVISIGEKPSVFTLDPSLGEFVLTNSQINIPENGSIYSVNEGNAALWDEPVTRCAVPRSGQWNHLFDVERV